MCDISALAEVALPKHKQITERTTTMKKVIFISTQINKKRTVKADFTHFQDALTQKQIDQRNRTQPAEREITRRLESLGIGAR